MKGILRFEMILLVLICLAACNVPKEEHWILDCGQEDVDNCGFKDKHGDLKIEYGKYPMIFTDTFKNYAIVLKDNEGFVGIDKKEKILFKVFTFDNGPDYVSENLFRIEKENKIGFVNYETGEIVIKPSYSGAKPFEKGYSAVCRGCEVKYEGEYFSWSGGKWGLVDKAGNVIVEPQYEEIRSIDTERLITIIENGVEKQVDIK